MTDDELRQHVFNLTGRVVALEMILAQTLAVATREDVNPTERLDDLRDFFEKRLPNLVGKMPEAEEAARDTAKRVYDAADPLRPKRA